MNKILFAYLIIGYVLAFNACCRAEYKRGITLDLFSTGVVILAFMLFWPVIKAIDVVYETVCLVIWKLNKNNQAKENGDERI